MNIRLAIILSFFCLICLGSQNAKAEQAKAQSTPKTLNKIIQMPDKDFLSLKISLPTFAGHVEGVQKSGLSLNDFVTSTSADKKWEKAGNTWAFITTIKDGFSGEVRRTKILFERKEDTAYISRVMLNNDELQRNDLINFMNSAIVECTKALK